ncbi:MAG TPA: glutathione S-transferase family protein [Rhodanobacter sp.]
MYTLYIANKNYSSWSLRPWLLLSELGIPFEERLVSFASGSGSSWDAFRAFSPNGKVPCLHDGDTVVWDSLGITEYLAERHPGIWPSDLQARAWARCAAAEMHAGFGALRTQCAMNCGIRMRLHELSPSLQKDLARMDELWNEGLRRFGGGFLAGSSFTAADAFFAPVAFRIQSYGIGMSAASLGYAARMRALPSMQRWHADALRETWRDPDHEDEVMRGGELLEDLRAV